MYTETWNEKSYSIFIKAQILIVTNWRYKKMKNDVTPEIIWTPENKLLSSHLVPTNVPLQKILNRKDWGGQEESGKYSSAFDKLGWDQRERERKHLIQFNCFTNRAGTKKIAEGRRRVQLWQMSMRPDAPEKNGTFTPFFFFKNPVWRSSTRSQGRCSWPSWETNKPKKRFRSYEYDAFFKRKL